AAGNYNIKVRLQADPTCMATYAQNPVVLNAPTGCCTPPTVNAPTVTQPTCATPTGTIVVNATGNGTLEYSVDNGATWQASNTFANLAAGNYNIKVRLQADPTCMATYAQNPVVLNAPTGCCTPPTVNAPTVTQPSCTVPTGTIVVNATGNGTLEYSVDNGATWQASSTFANLAAGNYNIKVRLQADPTCMAAYANNPVVINNAGGQIYNGNVAFYTQAQVNAWSNCIVTVNGSVTIAGFGITDLSPLMNIMTITGNLTIQSTGLTNLNGLNSLTTLGGNLTVLLNNNLLSLNGLNSLGTVSGSLLVYYNFLLSDCCAIRNLVNGGTAGTVFIFFNKTGCNSVAEINANCGGTTILAPPAGSQAASLSQRSVEKEIELFPNPTNGEFTLKMNAPFETGTVRIMDWSGRTIYRQTLKGSTSGQQFSMTKWGAGMYLVEVRLDGEVFTKRLVVK
ncbi:MAG TPA: T9SS type A sorting domain-containing protein, partial [Bacteroidetes bacterium]|nr:T9SS type A sorting domain-containing protein [Bacteroidota bacterium]